MSSDCCSGPEQSGYISDCQLTEALRLKAMKRNKTVQRSQNWQDALQYAKKVKLLLLDVDGVLTDGGLIFASGGDELKRFHAQDGLGITMLRECGIEVGIITARNSAVVARRAEDLKLTHVYQGARNKLTIYEEVLKKTGLRPMQTGYMGDDWIDLPLINRVGFAATPANGVIEIRQRAHYVTEQSGGNGAVREVCDLIMEAQGCYAKMFGRFDK